MTNEEDVIVDLKCIMNCLISEDLSGIEPIEKSINLIQENTKLKAEIDELNLENVCANHVIDKLKAEIEKLKSELEQSVKLPCKVGDMVYDNDFGKPTPSTIVGYSFGNIFQDDCSETEEEQIYFYSKSNRFNIETSFASSEIGKTIFLNKKEAEQSLKGEVSND